jgi:hypothetical protein
VQGSDKLELQVRGLVVADSEQYDVLCRLNVKVLFVMVALVPGSVGQRARTQRIECKEDWPWCCNPYRSDRDAFRRQPTYCGSHVSLILRRTKPPFATARAPSFQVHAMKEPDIYSDGYSYVVLSYGLE